MATNVSQFPNDYLQAICDALGDTSDGLTGSEIGRVLHEVRIDDPGAGLTKRYRLHSALEYAQVSSGSGNCVLAFIQAALAPSRWVKTPERLTLLRNATNVGLSFSGYQVDEAGKLHRVEPAATIDQATRKADRLRSELQRRSVHQDVLRYCHAELLDKDYFHAVLEASKGLAQRLRDMSGRNEDGVRLVDAVLGYGDSRQYPVIAFNRLETETEKSEHKGVIYLTKGIFSLFRNPVAHEPRVLGEVSEVEAIDVLTLISHMHKWLDKGFRTSGSI